MIRCSVALLIVLLTGCVTPPDDKGLPKVRAFERLDARDKSYRVITGWLKDDVSPSQYQYLLGYEISPDTLPPESQIPRAAEAQAATAATADSQPTLRSTNIVRYYGNVAVYVVGRIGQAENEHVITAAESTTFAIVPLGANRCTIMHYCHSPNEKVKVRAVKGGAEQTLTQTSYVDVTFDPLGAKISAPVNFNDQTGAGLDAEHTTAFQTIETLRTKVNLPCGKWP